MDQHVAKRGRWRQGQRQIEIDAVARIQAAPQAFHGTDFQRGRRQAQQGHVGGQPARDVAPHLPFQVGGQQPAGNRQRARMRARNHQGQAGHAGLDSRIRAFGPVQRHRFAAQGELGGVTEPQRRNRVDDQVELGELFLQPFRVAAQKGVDLGRMRTVRIRHPCALGRHGEAQSPRARVGGLQHHDAVAADRRQFQPIAFEMLRHTAARLSLVVLLSRRCFRQSREHTGQPVCRFSRPNGADFLFRHRRGAASQTTPRVCPANAPVPASKGRSSRPFRPARPAGCRPARPSPRRGISACG